MKTAFTIGTIILLIGPWSILSNISTAHPLDSVSRGSILYVGGSGPGNYTQIQDAIDNATSGDTIYVYAASSPYLENLRIAKTIQLLGENTNTTIIIGQNLHESVVTMSQAPNVTLAGFTIRYPISNNRTMVQVESSLTTIRNNYFNDIQENRDLNKKGILIDSRCSQCTIQNNTFHNISIAVYIDRSSFNTIEKNTFNNCYWGIEMNTFSTYTTIAQNKFIKNENAISILSYAISILSDNNEISNNSISLSGLAIDATSSNTIIKNNTIFNNTDGISITGENNSISSNRITNCLTGISCSGNNNLISSNQVTNCIFGIISDFNNNNTMTMNRITNCSDAGIVVSGCRNSIVSNSLENNFLGVYVTGGFYNHISRNNFINSKAAFRDDFLGGFRTTLWENNYWVPSTGICKVIFGRVKIVLYSYDFLHYHHEWAIYLPWVNKDRHPATEPYDLPLKT